jgi:hypothetical protein
MKRIGIIFVVILIYSNLFIAQNNNDIGKSHYTRAEIKEMCGRRIDPKQMDLVLAKQDSMYKDYLSHRELCKITTIPNWRSMMSPVESQNEESCPYSCWTHAATGVTEGQLHISIGSNIGIDLNEMDILYNVWYCDTLGWYVDQALDYIKLSKANVETGSYPNLYGVRWKISAYQSISGITAIKNALANGPVSASFYVCDDFVSFFNISSNKTAVYRYDGTSDTVGGHSIVIVSYDETNQYWLCKNSWGSSWADNGYFRIGFGQRGIESWDNYYISINQSCYAKIVPNLISSLTTALNYSYASNEYAYVYSGIDTLSGYTNPIPSSSTLVINSGTTVNLNGNSLIFTSGTLNNYGTISGTKAYLKNGSTIKGYCGLIQGAINGWSSGQTIEVISGTISENLTISSKTGLTIKGQGAGSTIILGTITASSCSTLTMYNFSSQTVSLNNCFSPYLHHLTISASGGGYTSGLYAYKYYRRLRQLYGGNNTKCILRL